MSILGNIVRAAKKGAKDTKNAVVKAAKDVAPIVGPAALGALSGGAAVAILPALGSLMPGDTVAPLPASGALAVSVPPPAAMVEAVPAAAVQKYPEPAKAVKTEWGIEIVRPGVSVHAGAPGDGMAEYFIWVKPALTALGIWAVVKLFGKGGK